MTENLPSEAYASSSPSSGGVGSYHGTPGTKVTEFSPEEFRGSSKDHGKDIAKMEVPPTFSLQGVPSKGSLSGKAAPARGFGAHDVFITKSTSLTVNSSGKTTTKLSPTAAAFKPGYLAKELMPVNTQHEYSNLKPLGESFGPQEPTSSAVAFLSATSVPDGAHLLNLGPQSQPPIGPPTHAAGPSASTELLPQFFSAPEGVTRCLKISQVDRSMPVEKALAFLEEIGVMTPKTVFCTSPKSGGFVFVRFFDLRHAEYMFAMLHMHNPEWFVQYVSPVHFMAHYDCQDTELNVALTSHFEGQVAATTVLGDHQNGLEGPTAVVFIRELLKGFGDLAAFNVRSIALPSLVIRAEYHDTRAASNAVFWLSSMMNISLALRLEHYTPDLPDKTIPITPVPSGPLIIGNDEGDLADSFGKMRTVDFSERRSHFVMSSKSTAFEANQTLPSAGILTPPSFVGYHFGASFEQGPYELPPVVHPAHFMPLYQGLKVAQAPRASNAMVRYQLHGNARPGMRQHAERSSGHHNVVDIARIRQGVDVRTTIMLRNIPNKVDQAMLKEIVDETSRGKYDFMYLRIDFANNCNVGYAFINFEDPYFITDFVEARAGQRWNRFNSDKIAEVSYATIQGKDCLVQKFRNSSVMLEHPSFRPKIFHTGNDPLAGDEETFPGPDNPSKMRRSIENAEHVGLFAPRAGQHFRDEQRRRRSQYDRGTRLAAIEDACGLENYEGHRFGAPNALNQGVRVPHYY